MTKSLWAFLSMYVLVGGGCALPLMVGTGRTGNQWQEWFANKANLISITFNGTNADLAAADESGSSYIASANVLVNEGRRNVVFEKEGVCLTLSMPSEPKHVTVTRYSQRLTPLLSIGHITIAHCDGQGARQTIELVADDSNPVYLVGYLQ